jgi:hypothetical protein
LCAAGVLLGGWAFESRSTIGKLKAKRYRELLEPMERELVAMAREEMLEASHTPL